MNNRQNWRTTVAENEEIQVGLLLTLSFTRLLFLIANATV